MLIFGHPKIPCPAFKSVNEIAQIAQSTNDTIVYFYAHLENACDLAQHCSTERVKYAVVVSNTYDLALMINFTPTYIIAPAHAQDFQSVANDYLLDAKILVPISTQEEIAQALQMRLDGVIFIEWFTRT
ncbi:hypothetical protein ACFOPX_06465 [Helicobacter baculiformis]|uniref:Uncharacterized protein n=1 Tax=Helicobacter baculiformis TaxID=427351 RepID=A0ABV7ZKC8_9HELI|nr:hypothetical protein [Helicobacter baculiformis]